MFDGLPKIVRVGGFDIRLEVKDTIEDKSEDERPTFGLYTHDILLIELRTLQPTPAFAVDTVLHELGHAIYTDRDLRPEDDEERVVGQMSRGYTQMFRENPELLAWVTKSLG